MIITVFRIDDRLIHGQIVTAWIAYSDAKQIVVADDKAAKDDFQKSLLKMATPKSVDLKIFSVDEAIKTINEDTTDVKTLLLVRGPQEALQLIEGGLTPKEINVGNLNMKKGKTKILGNLWVDKEDVSNFKKLDEKGIKLGVRTVPNDKNQDAMSLIK